MLVPYSPPVPSFLDETTRSQASCSRLNQSQRFLGDLDTRGALVGQHEDVGQIVESTRNGTRSAENRDDRWLVRFVHGRADGGDQIEALLRSRELGGNQQIDAIDRGSTGCASRRIDEAPRLGRRRPVIRDDRRKDV